MLTRFFVTTTLTMKDDPQFGNALPGINRFGHLRIVATRIGCRAWFNEKLARQSITNGNHELAGWSGCQTLVNNLESETAPE